MLEREEDQQHHSAEEGKQEALSSVNISDIIKQAKAGTDMATLLNSIPGALENHKKSLEDIKAGHQGITLEEFAEPEEDARLSFTVEDIMEITNLSRENAESLLEGLMEAARGEASEQPELMQAIEDVLYDKDYDDALPEIIAEQEYGDSSPVSPQETLSARGGRNTPEQVAAANARAKAYFASEPEESDEREQVLHGAMNLLKQRNGYLEDAILEQEIEETVRQRLASGKSREVNLDEIAASHGLKPEDYRQVD